MPQSLSTTKSRNPGRLFLCYAHSDRLWADWISENLSAKGFEVWRDVESLRVGDSWARSIDEAVRDSSMIIVLMSPAYFSSDWARVETASAVAKKVPIIPVLVQQCNVEGFLRYLNWADLTHDREKGMERLIEAAHHWGGR